MKQAHFKKITIVGVGLIGGSLGLAIKERKLADKVTGYFRDKEKCAFCVQSGYVDEGSLDFIESIKDSDLIILCSPVNDIISKLEIIKKNCSSGTIVTDTGSTKEEIVKAARGINFIGSHPLAGSEKSGAHHARKDLFMNALCVLTPEGKKNQSALKVLKKLWTSLGARTCVITPKNHDHLLAFVSHLPHAVAFSLIHSIPKAYIKFSAGGLKDTTRIALSSPHLWSDIFLTNKTELITAIRAFKKELTIMEQLLGKNKKNDLVAHLKACQKRRLGLFAKS